MTWIGRCDAEPCPPVPRPPDHTLIVRALLVYVRVADDSLGLGTSENYTLDIAFPFATLAADTVYGAMRGLETFGQLVQPDYSIRAQRVEDFPRFPFRAVLVDSSRHFLPVSLLLAQLDAMAPGQTSQRNQLIIVVMALDHAIDLQFTEAGVKSCIDRGLETCQHPFKQMG